MVADRRDDTEQASDEADDDDEEPVQVSHLVPPTHRERASKNTKFGGVSEAVREVYRLLAEGADLDTVRLEMKLEMVQREKERTEEQIDDLEDELAYLEERESELQERIDQYGSKQQEYDVLMTELDDELRDGYAVFTGHGKVERAADVSDHTPSEIIELLKERNPSVPDEQFEEVDEANVDLRSDQFSSVASQNE